MCAMYYYASKLTAAALSGGGRSRGIIGGGSGASGGGNEGGVCRCHEAQKEQCSPRRTTSQPSQSASARRHHPRGMRVSTPTLSPTITEHVVIEHPRPNHYHRHRTKQKVRSSTLGPTKLYLLRYKLVPWFTLSFRNFGNSSKNVE